MPLSRPLNRPKSPNSSLLSAKSYDPDASSIRSDQESDSDDDERQARARNSRELRAHDRIVLLEEEEMDQLVTEARRRQDRQLERRGSSLQRRGTGGLSAFRTPMRLFSGSRSDDSRSRSPGKNLDSQESVDDLRGEARKQRRQRRREKKDRLLEKANQGEDGELMHEMEDGGLKTGSSASSSDREYSDELDRRGLKHLADSKRQRKRDRWRWSLIYALIAAAFAVLAIVAWRMSAKKALPFKEGQTLVSNGTALFAPTTLIISLDGFRADFLQRGITPRLSAFIKEGVSPPYMNPSFPSVTFPNHFTMATGLYPESHGIVGNSFWDPEFEEKFMYTDSSISMQRKWWNGEPFWVTAEDQGLRSAIHMWPGSEAHLGDFEPAFIDEYNGQEKLQNKVSRIFDFLDRPGLEDPRVKTEDLRPQLIATYVPNVDSDGHRYGPNSTEIMATIKSADKMLDDIFIGLEARNLTNIVNVIIVSDHGMATTDVSRLIQMDDLVDLDKVDHIDGWPLVGLRPKDPADLDELYQGLVKKAAANPNFDVYLRDVNMPERYHFTKSDRIAPLWIIPKTGWIIERKAHFDVEKAKEENLAYHPIGLHGYDNEHPLMRAIFVARGPAFPHLPNSRLEPFQNIEVYNILCDSLGLTPAPNNGTLRLPLKPVGLHDDVPVPEVPVDPVTSYTLTPTPTPAPTSTPVKSLGVDPVATGDDPTPGSVGITLPMEPGLEEEADEELLHAAKDWWDWAKDEFGKAWSWTSEKAGKVWGSVKGGQGAEAQ